MTPSNLFQCKSCGFFIIAEELESHQCEKIKEYRIVDNVLWVNDGIRWYPLKLNASPKSEHPKFTPEDGTELTFAFRSNYSYSRSILLITVLT